MGTGEIVQFSVTAADYDSAVSIYYGGSCDDLTCVNGNNESPLDGLADSVIAQPMDEGQMYYVVVYGFGRSSGQFILESEVLSPPANDDCSGAVPLELGVSVASDSLAATDDVDLPICGP